jgi:hypothetical protein
LRHPARLVAGAGDSPTDGAAVYLRLMFALDCRQSTLPTGCRPPMYAARSSSQGPPPVGTVEKRPESFHAADSPSLSAGSSIPLSHVFLMCGSSTGVEEIGSVNGKPGLMLKWARRPGAGTMTMRVS